VESWNSHDLDRILSHYTDEFEMSSPRITPLMGEPSGTLKGKRSIRAYWEKALAQSPGLRFELKEVLIGANSVVICYNNVTRGKKAAEVFIFGESGKVAKSMAHYD
jgi:hypothetical protein